MNKSIGGYFQLELNQNCEYYTNCIRLNTARNALEYLIKSRNIKRIVLPKYICDSFLQPLKRNKIKYDFYNINQSLLPDLKSYDENSVLVLVNYFGLLDNDIKSFLVRFNNIIVDNSQAFFATPLEKIDTIYSPRKFFGVPDGAYLFTDKVLELKFDRSKSWSSFDFLVKRIDLSPEEAYSDFLKNEKHLNNQPIKRMSKITIELLKAINYESIKKKRQENFYYLHQKLKSINELTQVIEKHFYDTPLIYPLLIKKAGLREALIEKKIYVAQYWKDVLKRTNENEWEFYLVNNLVPLPIDQRYGLKEMEYITEVIK